MTIYEIISVTFTFFTFIVLIKVFFDKKKGSNDNLCVEIEKTNCNHIELKERVIIIETQFKNHVKDLKELKQLATDNHKEVIKRVESIYSHVNDNTNKVNELINLLKEGKK
jgi:hypothetical protein